MAITNPEFFNYSKKIASSFLMSAVIIDDQAAFSPVTNAPMPKKLKTPSIGAGNDEEIPSNTDEIDKSTIANSHNLNAKVIIDSFAKKGIFCSILKPMPNELAETKIIAEEMASRADVIIIDWVIPGENEKGATALQLLKNVAAIPGQLKLFVVYTGEPALSSISKTIKKMLGNDVTTQDDGLTLIKNSIRICIYTKPDTKVRADHKDRIVTFDNLIDICIEEFTKMTAGLVSNVALDAISQIRRNTTSLLNTFSKVLDPPYLTHRVLQPTPADAEHHLTYWIAQELNAVIEETDVCRHVKKEAIKKWVKSLKSPIKLDGNVITKRKVNALLTKGLDNTNIEGLSKTKKNAAYTFLTKTFSDDVLCDNADEKLACLSTVRTFYANNAPYLTQGTIVEKLKPNADEVSYYICIQPRCDCIRLKKERNFIFLPLKIISNDKFDIVIRHVDKYLRFAYEKNLYHLHIETFKPLSNQDKMTFKRNGKGQLCISNKTKQKFEWFGELRWEHSQRLSTDLSGNLARVGLNESEWLRKCAK